MPAKTNATGEFLACHTEGIKINEYVWQRVDILTDSQELRLLTVKRRMLSWFGHVSPHDTLPKIILQGTVDGGRRRGMPRESWKDNINE